MTENEKAKKIRLDRGETQVEFAKYFGITNSMVAQWENGRVPVPWYFYHVIKNLPKVKKKLISGSEFQKQRGIELRRKISLLMRQNPSWNTTKLASKLKVSEMTIQRHKRVIADSKHMIPSFKGFW